MDNEFRFAVEDFTGTELEDEEYSGVADAVLVARRRRRPRRRVCRCLTNLGEGGSITLLTPRAGQPGSVDASVIEESAVTAGLHTSGIVNASHGWRATRLVAPDRAA